MESRKEGSRTPSSLVRPNEGIYIPLGCLSLQVFLILYKEGLGLLFDISWYTQVNLKLFFSPLFLWPVVHLIPRGCGIDFCITKIPLCFTCINLSRFSLCVQERGNNTLLLLLGSNNKKVRGYSKDP